MAAKAMKTGSKTAKTTKEKAGKPKDEVIKTPEGELPEEKGKWVLWNKYGWLVSYHVFTDNPNVVVTRHFFSTPDVRMTKEQARRHWAFNISSGNFVPAGELGPVD